MTATGFAEVFDHLKPILAEYEGDLKVEKDTATEYVLNTPYSERWSRELAFGSVAIKKSYVSFHVFPVYMYPDLLEGVSEPLRKRMQGKNCFNFSRVDEDLFSELRELVARGFARLRDEGVIGGGELPSAAGRP